MIPMTDHKHTWTRSKRRHKREGRFFVQCTDPGCGIVRQATSSFGHLHVFHTGSERGGRSIVSSYRLKKWQKEILKRKKISFVQFVDEAFQKEKSPVD
jgi:hypothetical protein